MIQPTDERACDAAFAPSPPSRFSDGLHVSNAANPCSSGVRVNNRLKISNTDIPRLAKSRVLTDGSLHLNEEEGFRRAKFPTRIFIYLEDLCAYTIPNMPLTAIRTCSWSSQQDSQESQSYHLQTGTQLTLAVFPKPPILFQPGKAALYYHRFGNTAKRCNSFRLAISTSAPINSCTDEANALPV